MCIDPIKRLQPRTPFALVRSEFVAGSPAPHFVSSHPAPTLAMGDFDVGSGEFNGVQQEPMAAGTRVSEAWCGVVPGARYVESKAQRLSLMGILSATRCWPGARRIRPRARPVTTSVRRSCRGRRHSGPSPNT